MNKGKLIGGLLVAAGTAICAYYGIFYKFEDGLTAWQKLIGRVPEPEDKKDGPTQLDMPKENISVVTAPAFRRGEFMFANQDMGLFSKPASEKQYMKAVAKRFDMIGTYDSSSNDYPGWSKVWVTTTFKSPVKADVANKWFAYVKTTLLTNKKA